MNKFVKANTMKKAMIIFVALFVFLTIFISVGTSDSIKKNFKSNYFTQKKTWVYTEEINLYNDNDPNAKIIVGLHLNQKGYFDRLSILNNGQIVKSATDIKVEGDRWLYFTIESSLVNIGNNEIKIAFYDWYFSLGPLTVYPDSYVELIYEKDNVWNILAQNPLIIYGEKAASKDVVGGSRIASKLGSLGSGTNIVGLDTEVSSSELATHHLVLIGGPVANLIVRDINNEMSPSFSNKNGRWVISYQGREYTNCDNGLIVQMDNPYNSRYKAYVIAGLCRDGTEKAVDAFLNGKFSGIV